MEREPPPHPGGQAQQGDDRDHRAGARERDGHSESGHLQDQRSHGALRLAHRQVRGAPAQRLERSSPR
jgi:hypothetical protein